mgnify:CR=1 FL=1
MILSLWCAKKKLFSSTTKKPLTSEQLANIQTELGLIRLKVLWADSKKSAELAKESFEKIKADVEAGTIDPIKGTDLDKLAQ